MASRRWKQTDRFLEALCEKTLGILCGAVRHFPKERICAGTDSESRKIEEGCTLTVSCLPGPSSRAALTQEAGLGGGRHGVRASAADPHWDQGWVGRHPRVSHQHGGALEGPSSAAPGSPGTFGWKQFCGQIPLRNALSAANPEHGCHTRVTGPGARGLRASSLSAYDPALLEQAVLFCNSHKGMVRTRISSPSWIYKTLRSPV